MAAKKYYLELNRVMQSNPDSIPYDWLVHKFAEINIDAHFHNFSLEYPFAKNTVSSFFISQNFINLSNLIIF